MKKASIEWDTIAKIILGIAFLFLVLTIIYLSKEKLYDIIDKFKQFLRFG